MEHKNHIKPPSNTAWWLTYPSEKYEFVKWEYYSQYMEDIYSQSLSVGVPLNHSIDQPASFHRGKRRCFVHDARGATGLLAEQVLLNVALHINAYT